MPIEFTSYVAPNGTEYSFDDDERALLTEEGLGMPPISYITQQGPQQHGETIIAYRLLPRTIQLLVRQNSCSRTDYWTKRSLLIDNIKPNNIPIGSVSKGRLRKRFADGKIRDINVVIEQGPVFAPRDLSSWDEWGFTETLRFIAHDPTFYDPIEKSFSFLSLNDPTSFLIFPFSFDIIFGSYTYGSTGILEYKGTWGTFPKIVITGPMENLLILNLSTSEVIELNYNVSAGQIVTINLAFGEKTVTDEAGTNLAGAISLQSNLDTFHFAPSPEVTDGKNSLYVYAAGSTDDSNVVFYYNERFIGI